MKIHFLGAAQTVTGSQYLLEINGHTLLLECGLFQGHRKDFYERNIHFSFIPSKIDAVILSHAHIDHSGNLPNLIKQGFYGPIYTTPASAHLTNIMLMDSGHIQEADAEYASKRRALHGEPPIQPLYTQEDAAHVAQYFTPVPYHTPFEPIPGVTACLADAGHILGSAAVALDITEKRKKSRLWFSGDVGRRGLPLLRDPELPDKADYLMLECTYGDKLHRNPQAAYEELRQVVNQTIQRGGKVIIPAFAVGRTQELIYDLQLMFENGELPRVPIIVDSPLAANASRIFEAHPECFDEETLQYIREKKYRTALGFDSVVYTRSVEESKALNQSHDPMIIISASGMAEAGRILHHLRHNIENPLNTILIVSWQAPDTLGRRLADRENQVKIFGEVFERKAEVATIGGLSAHAGQDLLLEYALAVKATVRRVFLVHGEEKPAFALRDKLLEAGFKDILYPSWKDIIEI